VGLACVSSTCVADAAAHHVVYLTGPDTSDTWLWDGTEWTRVLVAGPQPPRQYAGLATLGNEAVLFGGIDAYGNVLSDTWTWNGASWMQLTVTGPSARFAPAMTQFNGSLVLYGGTDGAAVGPGELSDTWLFDGDTWVEAQVAGPPARYGAAVGTTGSGSTGQLVIFGGSYTVDGSGYDYVAYRGDTWLWDGSTWTEPSTTTAPGPRTGSQAASLAGQLVVEGGEGTGDCIYDSDTWAFDGRDWQSLSSGGPELADGAATTLGAQLVVFGGSESADPAHCGFAGSLVTWIWDGSSWSDAHVRGPESSSGMMSTL
jgi:hypothetical protein